MSLGMSISRKVCLSNTRCFEYAYISIDYVCVSCLSVCRVVYCSVCLSDGSVCLSSMYDNQAWLLIDFFCLSSIPDCRLCLMSFSRVGVCISSESICRVYLNFTCLLSTNVCAPVEYIWLLTKYSRQLRLPIQFVCLSSMSPEFVCPSSMAVCRVYLSVESVYAACLFV